MAVTEIEGQLAIDQFDHVMMPIWTHWAAMINVRYLMESGLVASIGWSLCGDRPCVWVRFRDGRTLWLDWHTVSLLGRGVV